MDNDAIEVFNKLRSLHVFNTLSDEELGKVYDRLKRVVFDPSTSIYAEWDTTDYLYILYTGRVRLGFSTPQGEHDYVLLEAPDIFGHEAIGKENHRFTYAKAVTRAVVLLLSVDDLRQLAAEIPKLAQTLAWIEKSFYLSFRVKLPWRKPREVLYLVTRRHPIFLYIRLILPGLFSLIAIPGALYLALIVGPNLLWPLLVLGLVFLICLGWVLWHVVDWANDYTILTNQRVIFLERVALLYDSRQEVPLDGIQAHEIRRDQFGRMLGYGNIVVRTFTGQLLLYQMPDPNRIINLLTWLREKVKVEHEEERRMEVNKTLRQRLGYEVISRAPDEASMVQEDVQPGPLQEFFSNIFRLRYEEGGVITHWTHWWMLVRRIWAPSLLLVVAIVLGVLSLFGALPIPPTAALSLSIVAGLILGVWWVYELIDWRNDQYIIGHELLVDLYRRPLGQEQRRTAPIKNIQTIEYERQGIIGLVLNFGTVFIRIGTAEFTFNNVYNPSEVQRELFQRFHEFKLSEQRREQERLGKQMGDYIEQYHDLTGRGGDIPNPFETGSGFG